MDSIFYRSSVKNSKVPAMPFHNPTLPKFHILLIDDSPDELRLLIETLRGTRCRLSVAFDGLQGYERAVARVPDLILLDVRMPKLDGFAVCRQLKANPRTARSPVIFLSSASDLDERLTGLREGAVDYILKPFSPEEVLARVQIHLALASRADGGDPEDGNTESGESSKQVLVQAAKRYLLERLADAPSLQALADALGSNPKRLTRAFKDVTGGTVFEFLRLERMLLAKRLLMETTLSIATISEEVGFSSAANFSTAFLEYSGLSPSAYRNAGPRVEAATLQGENIK